jgi:hypothetical protein
MIVSYNCHLQLSLTIVTYDCHLRLLFAIVNMFKVQATELYKAEQNMSYDNRKLYKPRYSINSCGIQLSVVLLNVMVPGFTTSILPGSSYTGW